MKILQLIIVILIAAFLFSCKATKDSRAMNRVKADINLLNNVGNEWQKLHPCTVDTVREFINGKEIIRYDTLNFSHTDTVYNGDTQTKIIYRTIEKSVTKVDTAKVYVIDNRAERLAQTELNKAQGQIAQLEKENSELKKENKSRMWWLIGVSVFSILLTGGLTYLLFKK